MTETSRFWDGTTVGDATLAPYSADIWHTIWQIMFSRADNEGVLNGVDNELAVTGVAGGVSVATGKALVDGSLYESSAAVTVTMATPETNPRIDRIVLQKNWATQTVRIARLDGTEAGSPTAPALTQTAGSVWEVPLAQALITTAGVITVTDERENARTRLAIAGAGITAIETFTATGVETSIDFSSIPDTFKHLILRGNVLSSVVGVGSATIAFNGDSVAANYNRMIWGRSGGAVVASANAGALLPRLDTLGSNADSAERNTQLSMFISNYKDTTFYKVAMQKEMPNADNTLSNLNITQEMFTWLSAAAINRIQITPDGGSTFEVGTVVTLFGVD